MSYKYEKLMSPLKVAGLTLKNRIFSAPTSVAELGPNERYSEDNINYYRLRAVGGAAVVCVGEGNVDLATGRSHPQQCSPNDPGAVPYMTALTDAIHQGGAFASIELDHGGALCDPSFIPGHLPSGPSSYIDPWGEQIYEMTEEQIYAVADKFAEAAQNALACGYDMITIHAGHGWLLHEFISPVTNFRTDKWGGSLENRMRFPLLVIDKVRQVVGKNVPIEVRMSGSERLEGGYDLEEGVEIAKMLDGKCDLIHVSAGTQQDLYSAALMHPGMYQKDMENAYLAAEIKKHVKTPVVTVGAFNLPDDMENFLEEGHADVIALGRALIADPFLPKKILTGRADEITPCIRCMKCFDSMCAQRVMRCTVNPIIGREKDVFHPIPVTVRKKVLIAGAGPAGMEAAIQACKKGHEVVLCEKTEKLGALGYVDKNTDFKQPLKRYRDSQIKKVQGLPIDIRMNTVVTQELVNEVKPDVLIAAVGSEPITLSLPGIDGENVIQGAFITDQTPIGDKVVIIGGGIVGCEEAIDLARKGHEVTIIEMQSELASDAGLLSGAGMFHELEILENITPATGRKCSHMTKEGVYAIDAEGNECFYPADTIVLAMGMCARKEEVERLRGLVDEFYVIGDANRAGQIVAGTKGAYDAVVTMGLF
ncbi:MAG: FAD-dependent oxidoreductase [Agathobacter sp.]